MKEGKKEAERKGGCSAAPRRCSVDRRPHTKHHTPLLSTATRIRDVVREKGTTPTRDIVVWTSLGPLPRWYQDRLLGGPLGLPDLCHTAPNSVRCKDYGGEVLGWEAIHTLYCVEDS
jgi:hypothetical protein